MFNFLKKKAGDTKEIQIKSVVDGELFNIGEVNDDVFSQNMLGDGVAFRCNEDTIDVVAPVDGELTVVFPTGHAFGITTKDGVEVLVHIGIDTVEANGDGFVLKGFKQGDAVKTGDVIETVDMKKLRQSYDMSIMLIVTNANGKIINFIEPKIVEKGDSITK